MNSRKVFAVALAAALSTASVSVCAFAADPVAKSFKVTKAGALGGNGVYINASSEENQVAPGATDGDGGVNGSVKVDGNTVEYTPAYSCYGAENDKGKAPIRVTAVTDIDYSDEFTTTYDSAIKNASFTSEGGKLRISFTANAASYGKTTSVKFQDKDNFYVLNVKNSGYKGEAKVTGNITNIDGASVSAKGTNVELYVPADTSITAMQQSKYNLSVEIQLGDKVFTGTTGDRFWINTVGSTKAHEVTVSGFNTAGKDSVVDDDRDDVVYANNFTMKLNVTRNDIPGVDEPVVDIDDDPNSDTTSDTSDTTSGGNDTSDGVVTDNSNGTVSGDKTNANNGGNGTNKPTGVALAIAPVVLAAGSVVASYVIKKRK